MKIIFMGLGSIGKRHARMIQEQYNHELYAYRSTATSQVNELGIKELYSFEEVVKLKPDIAFITNPTSCHLEASIACAKEGMHLFIEKPLGRDTSQLDALLEVVSRKNLTAYVAYVLRFHPVIQRLKEYIEQHPMQHMRVITSSYLPDWRPNRNHLETYSAKKSMGGGVILDLSHELDCVFYLAGSINSLQGEFSRRGNVTVDAEDYADIIVETGMGPVNIHMNFMSHINERIICVDFECFSLKADLINYTLNKFKNSQCVDREKYDKDNNDPFKKQLEYFFANIHDKHLLNNVNEAAGIFRKIHNFRKAGNW